MSITQPDHYTPARWDGHLYIVLAPTWDGVAFKLGWSRAPEKRAEKLATGSPTWDGYHWVSERLRAANRREREIHQKLHAYRIRAEWFEVNDQTRQIIMGSLGVDITALR